jgi:hypothetical protein
VLRNAIYGLFLFVLFCWGCTSQEPPLSQGALRLKHDFRDVVSLLIPPLVEPASRDDAYAVSTAIDRLFSDAEKRGKPIKFVVVVLDKNGVSLATRLPEANKTVNSRRENYRNYTAVLETLKEQRASSARLYLQNGSHLFVICSPLLTGGRVVGVLVVGLTTEEISKSYGITEKEFLRIDFNR